MPIRIEKYGKPWRTQLDQRSVQGQAEQSDGIAQVNQAMVHIDGVTQQNAALVGR